jgi:hypothetical protein
LPAKRRLTGYAPAACRKKIIFFADLYIRPLCSGTRDKIRIDPRLTLSSFAFCKVTLD